MKDVIHEIRRELQLLSDENNRNSVQRFFKEAVKTYGVKTPVVRKIGNRCFMKIKESDKGNIFGLCEELWRSGYLEESIIAANWSYALRDRYEPMDLLVFEHWLNAYVSNWASCDTLCNHTVGALVDRFPDCLSRLKGWTLSENRWLRRAAAVSLIVAARNGKFLNDIFTIADLLLVDDDDLVRKGYGWMLKAASQAHLNEVFDYVLSRKETMPRTAYRYAIEKMPTEMKRNAME